MTDVEAELRAQLTDVLGRAEYPVADPLTLIPVLPEGARTTFEAGDVVVPAIDLGLRYGTYQEYPYANVEALVEDVLRGMRAEGELG